MIITDEIRAHYKPTIGIECHVQLKTKTKLFAPVDNDARESEPNTKISAICLGLPGVLPVLNKSAVDLAIRAGRALNATINTHSSFDRKHYFYPDLPKGYQITQFQAPIVGEGAVEVPTEKGSITVRITRAHLEEDAGKSTHPSGADYSLVDLNRAGTPLLEIVSEPDMHSPAEARAFAHELYLLMKYADVSEADLFHGNMRFDVNVSLAPVDSNELGLRAEVKNINSFRSVERAVEYEIKRQIELLEKGQTIAQETRGWDEDKGKTISQRSKENAHDYRYFPDPDIPPVVLAQQYIDNAVSNMPTLPQEYRIEFTTIGLTPSVTESLLENPEEAQLIRDVHATYGLENARQIALWIVNVLRAEQNDFTVKNTPDTRDRLQKLAAMVEANELSSTAAKEVFLIVVANSSDPRVVAEKAGLLQNSNEDDIAIYVQEAITANPKAAEDVTNGEMKAIGFLVGQIMKKSKGQANPSLVTQEIKKQLGA